MSKAPIVTIKFYEVLNWLFSNDLNLPEKFQLNPNKLDKVVPYITEQFWTIPWLTSYLNKHTNDLYNQPDPLEALKLLKKIVRDRGLTKANCWSFFPNRSSDLLKELRERDELDEGNARAKRMLMKKLAIDSSGYFRVAPTKKNINLNDNVSKVIVKEALQIDIEQKKKTKEEARVNDSRFLPRLNQEVIDELELIIFDVSLLKKTNRVLFTFIDSNNLKRYFMTPFMAEVYLSKKNGVINNDYIEEATEEDFIRYAIKDHKLYNKLKYMLNKSYTKTLNSTSFVGESHA